MSNMQYSKTGLALTENFEGCRLKAYQDIRGIWTVGYGHTGPDVHVGMVITQGQAEALLAQDIQHAAEVVNRLVTVPVTQGEFDALTDFVYNLGEGHFAGSTLLKLLNEGNYQGAAAEFDKWSYAAAIQVAGLLRRRQAETAEFNHPDGNGPDITSA